MGTKLTEQAQAESRYIEAVTGPLKQEIITLRKERDELRKKKGEFERLFKEGLVKRCKLIREVEKYKGIVKDLQAASTAAIDVFAKVRGLAEEWQLLANQPSNIEYVAGESHGMEVCADQVLRLIPASVPGESPETPSAAAAETKGK